jgi:glycosyltransferase involved in cell wall biosynthesis
VHIVYFGTYDLDKPRNGLIISALRERGHTVTEIHTPVWRGVRDKSQVRGPHMLWLALRWLAAYPGLIWRYCRTPRHDAVMVGYLGHLDVLVVAPFARWRGVPILWDAFLSIYDTVVRDRRLLSPGNPLARLLRCWERAACHAADRVILDTSAHADMFAELYKLDRAKFGVILIGARLDRFRRQAPKPAGTRLRVLFFGQFIPLHGIGTIVNAARKAPDVDWVLIGTGQETAAIEAALAKEPVPSLEWHSWVDNEALIDYIAGADVCLGVFGGSEKASRVIPNKVYETLVSGRPLVTRRGPGIAELLDEGTPGVRLVPPEDPQALVRAVRDLGRSGEVPPADITRRFDAQARAEMFEAILREVVRAS